MWNPQKVRKLYLLPTYGMRGALLPTPSVHCHGIGDFNLLLLRTFISYLFPLVLSRIYILPPPTSCTFFLPASSSTSPSSCLSVSSSLSYSYVLGPALLVIFLPLLILFFVSYFIFHDLAFSCWLLSFCHFMCVFLRFSCSMFVRFCPFNLPFASSISSYKLLHTIVSNLLLLSSTSYLMWFWPCIVDNMWK